MLELRHGDNVLELDQLSREGQRFALAYLDPPFCSRRVHRMPDGEVAFDDRWPSRAAWLGRLMDTLHAVHGVLVLEGSIVVHVDPKVSPWVRMALDEIFGEDRFASEIVWRYRRWPSKTPNFQRVHDVLIRYRRSLDVAPRFRQLYEPLSASTLAQWGTGQQRAEVGEDGRRRRSTRTAKASPGVPMGDVWDLPIIAPVANERTGFPTQKPRALLERLLLSLTEPGDHVLDPYCGSGTTLDVCRSHDRHAVGIDSSPVAIRVASARLELAPTSRRRGGALERHDDNGGPAA